MKNKMSNSNLSSRVIQNLNNIIFSKKPIDIRDTILVAGSPRSGTTWFAYILSNIPKYTYIFEPLNPIWFPESYKVGFKSRSYLLSNIQWQEGENYLRKIFTGNIANLPIKDNKVFDLLKGFSIKNSINNLFGTKLIVKSTNMNRMLPWISKKFNLRTIFLIVRHPCACISSQMKSGLYGYRSSSPPYIDIKPTKKIILDEIKEMKELNEKIKSKIKNIEKIEEILATVWCLDNNIILTQKKPYPWKIVFYEKLIKEGKSEIKNVFNEIGEKNIPKSTFYKFRKPSVVTMKEDKKFLHKPKKQLSKWREYLSDKQISRILKILSYFEIDFYSEKIEPNYEKI
jgi:hypothetical protein